MNAFLDKTDVTASRTTRVSQRGNQYGWHLSENISGGAHA